MTNTLYSQSNLMRKKPFRIITSIVTNNKNKIVVLKKPVTKSAEKHIKQIHHNEIIYQKYLQGIGQVLISQPVNKHLEYNYIKNLSLDLQIVRALTDNNYPLATSYFSSGLNIINKLPSIKLNKYPQNQLKNYSKIFKKIPNTPNIFFPVGNIDINTDNIFIDSGTVTFIDCEWITNFPIEKNFILYRYCFYCAIKYSHLFTNTDTINIVEFWPEGPFLPQQWFDLAFDSHLKLQDYFLMENNFQNYVNLNKTNSIYHPPQITEKNKPQRDPSQQITLLNNKISLLENFNLEQKNQILNTNQTISVPQNNLDKLVATIKTKNKTIYQKNMIIKKTSKNFKTENDSISLAIHNTQEEINNLNNLLDNIRTSKFFKLWQSFNKIKKIFK